MDPTGRHVPTVNVFVHASPLVLTSDLWKETGEPGMRARILGLWQEQNPTFAFRDTTEPAAVCMKARTGKGRRSNEFWLDATFTALGLVCGLDAISPLPLAFKLNPNGPPVVEPLKSLDVNTPSTRLAAARVPKVGDGTTPAPHNPVPRIIWTYWNSTELPPLVRACIDTWARWNPTYEIRIVTPENVATFLERPPAMVPWTRESPQKESDYARVCLLAKYGGVWSDATVFCTGPFPLQAAMDVGRHDFYGYTIHRICTNPRFPTFDSWWFAAPAGSVFMREWATAFTATRTVPGRVRDILSQGVDPQKLGPNLNYFLIHLSAQLVLQKVVTLDYIRDRMELHSGDAESGPLWFFSADNLYAYEPTKATAHLFRFVKSVAEGRAPFERTGLKGLSTSLPCLLKLTRHVRAALSAKGQLDEFTGFVAALGKK